LDEKGILWYEKGLEMTLEQAIQLKPFKDVVKCNGRTLRFHSVYPIGHESRTTHIQVTNKSGLTVPMLMEDCIVGKLGCCG